MLEEIKKILFSGLGVILVTREKVEEVTRKLVDEAKLSKEEARDLADELFETGSKQWSDMETSITRTVQKGIQNLDVASRKELDECQLKVANLEKRIGILEDQLNALKES